MIFIVDKSGRKKGEVDASFVFQENSKVHLRFCKNCGRGFIIWSALAGRQNRGGRKQWRVNFCPLCYSRSFEKLTKKELIHLLKQYLNMGMVE